MRTYLGVLAVFIAAAAALVIMLVFATPYLGFGLLAEVVTIGVALAVAVATARVVLPRA